MCFGGGTQAAPPSNPAPYTTDQAYTQVQQTAAPQDPSTVVTPPPVPSVQPTQKNDSFNGVAQPGQSAGLTPLM